MSTLFSLRFHINSGRTPKGRPWFDINLTFGHYFAKVGQSMRFNWTHEYGMGFHTWWVNPGYHDCYYDGPHPAISLGFIVITWEPWGGGEWVEPEYIDGKKIEAPGGTP